VLLIALLVVFLAGVAVIAVAVTRGPDPAPASATAPTTGPADASPAVRPDARTATPADAAVLQNTIDEVVTDHPLRFPADATTPAPGTADTIDRLAAVLRATPGPPVVLEGHTAPAGESTGAAATLSRQRAEEVARRLEAAGVPTGRLTTVGVGPDRPLASLEASRRVEVRVGS
jgi:outer membrane protein OmpA-like peptidoglycan-associated protein